MWSATKSSKEEDEDNGRERESPRSPGSPRLRLFKSLTLMRRRTNSAGDAESTKSTEQGPASVERQESEQDATRTQPDHHRQRQDEAKLRMPSKALFAASRLLNAPRRRARTMLEKGLQSGHLGKLLLVGDVISLHGVDASGGTDSGALVAQGFNECSVGIFAPSRDHSTSEEEKEELTQSKSEMLFRVCPQLRYDMQKSLEKLSKTESSNMEKKAYLMARAEREARENEEILAGIESLKENENGQTVRYGQVIQLQHVKSQKFLSLAPKKVAVVQKDCLKIELTEEGSEWSWFRVMPRFKVRSEGSQVYCGDQIYLQSVKQDEYWLNFSHGRYPAWISHCDCVGLTSRKPWKEANLSVQAKSWRAHLMMRGCDPTNPSRLYDGQAIYLYHAEVEGLISGSSSFQSSKISVVPSDRDAKMKPDRSLWVIELDNEQQQGSLHPLDAEESHAATSTSTSVAQKERRRTKRSFLQREVGSIHWGDSVSFRHLSTGRYLSVDSSSLHPTALSETGTLKVICTVEHLGPLSTFVISPSGQRKKKSDLMESDEDFEHQFRSRENNKVTGGAGVATSVSRVVSSEVLGIPTESLTACFEFIPPDPIRLPDGSTIDRTFLHAFNAVTASKEEANRTIESGGSVVLSIVKYDQDAIQVTLASRETVKLVDAANSWCYEAMAYSDLLHSRLKAENLDDMHLSKSDVNPVVTVLSEILSTCELVVTEDRNKAKRQRANTLVQRKSSSADEDFLQLGEDEIEHEVIKNEAIDQELAAANKVFSKPLPPSDLAAQVRLSELRMFEVLLHLISLPAELLQDNWVEKLQSPQLRWCYFVHRLAMRAATAIFKDNREIELVFAEKVSLAKPRRFCEFLYKRPPKPRSETIGSLMVVAKQLTCGLGAVSLLRQLVNNNKILLDTKFKKTQIAKLVDLIRRLGPKKRYLDLLASLCTCEDDLSGTSACVVSNQELIVRELFYESPHQVLIESSLVMYEEDSGKTTSQTTTSQQDKSNGDRIWHDDNVFGAQKLLASPSGALRHGEVLVSWDKSFAAVLPEDIGCQRVYSHKGKHWVSLVDLQSTLGSQAREILAYYHGQLSLFSKLAEGRSYNCIHILERKLSFETLLIGLSKSDLQPSLRACFANLLKVLYLDRHPHAMLRIPRQVFFRDKISRPEENPYGAYRDPPSFQLPACEQGSLLLVQSSSRQLDVDGELEEAPDNAQDGGKEAEDQVDESFFRINSPDKFLILFNTILKNLEGYCRDSAQVGKSSLQRRGSSAFHAQHMTASTRANPQALLMHSMVDLCTVLLKLGFLPKPEQLQTICQLLASILELHERKSLCRSSMALQQCTCEFLGAVCGFRVDQHVSLSLEGFVSASKSTALQDVVEAVVSGFLTSTGPSSSFPWDMLDLNKATSQSQRSLDQILVHLVIRCGKEADPSVHVFEKALDLLILEHSKASQLVEALSKMLIINSSAGIQYFKMIKGKASVVLDDLQSYEIWGVSNEFSPTNQVVIDRVVETLRFFVHACKSHRFLMESLNIVDIIFIGLRIESESSAHLTEIKNLCLFFLEAFVEGDSENQALVFGELPLLVSLIDSNKKAVVRCLSAVVKANRRLCVEFPEQVIDTLVSSSAGLNQTVLGFLCQLCSVNGIGMKRNQDIVLHALLQNERVFAHLRQILQSLEQSGGGVQQPTEPSSTEQSRNHALSSSSSSSADSSAYHMSQEEHSTTTFGLNTQVLALELLSAITRGRNPFSEAKVQVLVDLNAILQLVAGDGAKELPNVLRCVLLRFLADAFFDTGLANAGSIQQHPRVGVLFESMHAELVSFEQRNAGGDSLPDTMSEFRSLVFHGFCFTVRSFFQHAFQFHSAPNNLLSIREPLLSILQKVTALSETPAEQYLAKRARAAVLKSVRGHRRKKVNDAVRKEMLEEGRARKELEKERAKKEALAKRVMRGKDLRPRGKANSENWEAFVARLKRDPRMLRIMEEEECSLVQSIVLSSGSYDSMIRFHKALMDHVRASCENYLLRPSSRLPVPRTVDHTAQQVLKIIRLLLKHVHKVSPPWHMPGTSRKALLFETQSRLTTMGAVDMCFELFCGNTSQDLDRATIEILISLLEGGNKHVQERLYDLLVSGSGEKFFAKLEQVFRTIGEAAKLEIKMEKKRRAQADALVLRQDSDSASVFSGGSSIVLESIGATSFQFSSWQSMGSMEEDGHAPHQQHGQQDAGDMSASSGSDEDDDAGSETLDMDRFMGLDEFANDGGAEAIGEENDEDDEGMLDIEGLFETNVPRSSKALRRRRTQAELQQKQNARDIVTVIRFLQLCMEGHYLDMQDLLRDQSELTGHRHSVNIIARAVGHAQILTKNDELLASARAEVLAQLTGIFDFLVESMQGPCYDNQLLLADPLHHVVEMIKRILLTTFALSEAFFEHTSLSVSDSNRRASDGEVPQCDEQVIENADVVLELKGKALRTLVSMLEGRQDQKVIEILASELDPSLLRARFVEIHRAVLYFEHVHDQERRKNLLDQGIDIMTIMTALSDFHRERIAREDEEYSLAEHRTLFSCSTRELAAINYFGDTIRSVEVYFKGTVQRVFFPKPLALRFLSHSARIRLLHDVDVTDADSRLREFLEAARSLLDEITQIQQISDAVPSFIPAKRLLMDLDFFRQVAFNLALMSNFLLVLTMAETFGDETATEESDLTKSIDEPVCLVPAGHFAGMKEDTECLFAMTPRWNSATDTCLLVVHGFTVAQILILLLLRALHIGTQGPIVFKKLVRKIQTAKTRRFRTQRHQEQSNGDHSKKHKDDRTSPEYRALVSDTLSIPTDKQQMSCWTLFGVLSSMTAFLVLRFGTQVLWNPLYVGFVKLWCAVLVTWFLRSERYAGGVTFSRVLGVRGGLWFCCAFDVLGEVETVFQVCCIVACYYGLDLESQGYLLTVPLFDIVLSNETLLNVVRAVVVPIQSLFMTFILLALTLYSFAFVAFVHFRGHFFDEETEENVCKDLLGCFLLSLDVGLRIGEGPAAVMTKVSRADELSLPRYAFDLLFVVIISIFLLNVVFGIIIDTFSALREAQHERESQLNNYCFICGLQRGAFDRIAFEYKQKQDELPHTAHREFKSGFFYHITEEHCLFDYLAFILHLEEKDKTECNGVESFVLDELAKSGGDPVSWIPNGRALALGSEKDDSLSMLEQIEASMKIAIFHQNRLIGRLNAKLDSALENFSMDL